MSVGGGGAVKGGEGAGPLPPVHTGTLYSPQFRSHQDTKMAARRNQRSTYTILGTNRGLWRV